MSEQIPTTPVHIALDHADPVHSFGLATAPACDCCGNAGVYLALGIDGELAAPALLRLDCAQAEHLSQHLVVLIAAGKRAALN